MYSQARHLKLTLKSYGIKIAGTHFRVDIRIGTVGLSGGNAMTLSRFDEPVGQYHSQ